MAEHRPQFFTVLPSTGPTNMTVVNGYSRRKAPVQADLANTRAMRRRSGLDLLSKEVMAKMAYRRMRAKRRLVITLPSALQQSSTSQDPTSDASNLTQTMTLSLPVNEQHKHSDLLDLLMKPVMQVSSIDRPQPIATPPALLPQSFLDDNPTPKELTHADIVLDPASVPLPALPAVESAPAAVQFPSYAAPVDVEEMTKAPPKVSVHNHQKRHQGNNHPGAVPGTRDDAAAAAAADMEEIDKKRAEMQLAPLSAGPNDHQFEVKLLKKFVNRTRVMKKYMSPNALTREMASTVRRDSLFHVMDNPADIRTGGADGMTMATPPPLGSMHHQNRPRHMHMAGDGDDSDDNNSPVRPSHRSIISLEARHKDVHNLRHTPGADLDDDDSGSRRRSTNLFQKFCHHIVHKQRTKYQLRVGVNIISEIDNPDAGGLDAAKKKAPPARRQPDRDAAKAFLSDVDAVLSLDELYEEAVTAEKARNWRRATLLASACISMEKEWTEPLLLRARLCRRLGLWTQALKDLTAALRLCPNHQRLLLQRAHVHTQMQEFHSAIVDLSHVLNQQPNSAEALLLRSKVYAKQGHATLALKDLTSIVKTDPKNWRAYYERAYLRHRQIEGMADDSAAQTAAKDKSDTDQAASVTNIPSLIVQTIEDYMNAIRTGCFLNDVIETIGDLTIRLVEWTHDAKHCLVVVGGLTTLIALMDENDAKVKDRRRAGKPQSTGHDATSCEIEEDRLAKVLACLLTQRGRLYILIGQHVRASTDLDRAVIMDYHYAPAHFFRGAVASVHANDDASRKVVLQHLNRCIHLDPTITGAYIVRGGVFCADLRFNHALQDFKAAVTIDPTLDDIWIQIAIVFLTHYHDCDACAKACTRALKNDLGLTQALHLRGEALARQGSLKAAMRDFVRLVVMQPTDRFAHLMKGKLLLQLDHARSSLYAYKQFMEMGSEQHTLDRITRGKAYKVLSQHSQAVKEFKLAVDANPTPENLCLLSESLHSMGDTEASLHVINLAIASDPACARSYVRRAQCYIGNHAYKTAILDYDFALTLADKSELYRMYYERALCRSQLLSKAWNQLYAMQRGDRVPCYFENNFRPGSPLPVTLPAADMNVTAMTAFIQQTYVETANDFAKCMKASEVMCDPYIERAALYVLGGEFNRAYDDLATAIKLDPRNLNAYISAGVLKCRFSMYTASIECYDQALKHHPNCALAYYNRGVSYHILNVWAQADADYSKSIALDPTNMDAVRNRGIARCHLMNFTGAAEDFEEVHKSAPDDMELHMGLGYVYLKLSRFTEAIALFKSLSSNNPTATDAYVDAGNTFFTMATCIADSTTMSSASVVASTASKGDTVKSLLRQSLHCYLRAVRINPTDVKIRLNLAALFRARGDHANAFRQYRVVMAVDPNNQDFHDEKAMMLLERGEFEEAMEHMHAAVNLSVGLSPIVEMEYALLVKNKSMALHELHRRRQLMRPPSPLAPTSPDGRSRRMSIKAEVLADKKSILGIKKTLSMHLANRGKVSEQMQRADAAREDYLHAVYFDPLAYDVYFHLGTLALHERKLDECIEYLTQALVINPKLGVASLNLGVAYLLLKAYDDAQHHLDAAAEVIPDCAFVWANKACVSLRLTRVDDALRHLSHAMKCLPTFAPLYVFRGRLLSSQKHLHDSMVDFAAALKMGYTGDL